MADSVVCASSVFQSYCKLKFFQHLFSGHLIPCFRIYNAVAISIDADEEANTVGPDQTAPYLGLHCFLSPLFALP